MSARPLVRMARAVFPDRHPRRAPLTGRHTAT
ncbi:hypothetical protein LUTEI9C_60102 [Luteimonas sp. 9C]|nr:hypothetical protein LUTEI9C_60102 [Luteimonas sp. 9C]